MLERVSRGENKTKSAMQEAIKLTDN